MVHYGNVCSTYTTVLRQALNAAVMKNFIEEFGCFIYTRETEKKNCTVALNCRLKIQYSTVLYWKTLREKLTEYFAVTASALYCNL